MKKPSCFGFVREIPEALKSNFSNLHFRGKNSTVVSGDTEKETERPTDDQKTIEESENTVGSSTNCSLKTVLELYQQRAHNLRVFSVSELKTATNNFAPDLKIGEGGFGSVYSGSIKPTDGSDDEILVAVKCLNKHGLQGHKEWVAEVKLLGIADHPNVVKLIGYCAVDGERGIQRFLVYEFMPNKSLEIHLLNKGSPVLPWDKRLQVAFCTARGLTYLQEELEVQVIFRDFKSSNILLDLDFNPKLSDFGLAREGPSGGYTHVTTVIVGTAGYAAPEYIRTGHLTYKSDVWSFGVVLYELLTGRRSIENNRPRHERNLLEWVKHYPADNRKFHKIVDPRLGNRYSLVAAQRMAKLADSCLVKNPKIRPEMSKVVKILHEIMEISKSGHSQNLIVQHVNLDSFESDEKRHKQREPLCQDGSPDVAGARTSRRRLRKENGHAFNRRRLVVMSKEQWEASQQNLQQQCQMQKHHERHQNQSQQ